MFVLSLTKVFVTETLVTCMSVTNFRMMRVNQFTEHSTLPFKLKGAIFLVLMG